MIFPAHPYRDAIPGACELDSIPYQVKEDLLIAFLIGHHFRWYIRRYLEIQIDSFLSSLQHHDSNNFLQGIFKVKFTKIQLKTIVLEAWKV